MDENISHAIALMGATILFIIALSLSIIFYDGLEERAEDFFESTSTGARQEDATLIQYDEEEVDRKITFQEVYLSILNLPAYVSGDGNVSDSKIVVNGHSGNTVTYIASFDIENNIKKVTASGTVNESYLVGKKDPHNPMHSGLESLEDMIKDFSAVVLSGASTSGTSNGVLKNNKDLIKDTDFSISYSTDAIIYTIN